MEKNRSLFPRISTELLDLVRAEKNFALMSHKNPDGDAVCSVLALQLVLEKLGKTVMAFSDGPFARREIRQYEKRFSPFVPEDFRKKNPVVVILDCSTEDRPGEVYKMLKGSTTIVVDHHSSGVPFYRPELSYIIPESPSTTLLVDEIRQELGVALDKEMAELMMVGFLTDTGFFHFLNERQAPDSFEKIMNFTRTGISPYEIYDQLNDGRKLEDLKIIADIIKESKTYFSGRLIIAVEKKDLNISEKPGDTVYRSLLEVENVKAIVLIKENDDGVEIGFRAKNKAGIDVGRIAQELGGGGHKLASGASIEGIGIDEAVDLVLSRFKTVF